MERIGELLKQIKKHPDRPELHTSIAHLYQMQGNATEAAKHYFAAARIFSSKTHPSRDHNRAIAILKRALNIFPENHDSRYLLAEIYQEMGNVEQACEILSDLTELYRKEKKMLMAVSVYGKVTAAKPADPEVWDRFAALNLEARMPFHAAQAYLKAAVLRMEQGDLAKAYHGGITACRLVPDSDEIMGFFARLFRQERVHSLDPMPLFTLSDEFVSSGNPKGALSLLAALEGTSLQAEGRARAGEIGVGEEKGRPYEGTASEGSLRRRLAGAKVLVVEDEREILLLLEQILQGEGLSVLPARDGEEGLAVFRREQPSLVVSDAMLPKLHGFELCRTIKEEAGDAVRIMILTAVYKKYKYKGKVEREFKVDEYLDKPFQIKEFLEAFYRMAGGLKTLPTVASAQETKEAATVTEETADRPSLMVAGESDRSAISRISEFAKARELALRELQDARALFEELSRDLPDILFLSDRLTEMTPNLAAWMTRKTYGSRTPVLVLLTHDPKLLEGGTGEFNHRVASPPAKETLESVLRISAAARMKRSLAGMETARERSEKRIDAVLRNKVEKVLKNQIQIEEYYRDRIRVLEETLARLRKGTDTGHG